LAFAYNNLLNVRLEGIECEQLPIATTVSCRNCLIVKVSRLHFHFCLQLAAAESFLTNSVLPCGIS